jgi:hypothetical protein
MAPFWRQPLALSLACILLLTCILLCHSFDGAFLAAAPEPEGRNTTAKKMIDISAVSTGKCVCVCVCVSVCVCECECVCVCVCEVFSKVFSKALHLVYIRL